MDRFTEKFAKNKDIRVDEIAKQLGMVGLISMNGSEFAYKSLQKIGTSGLSSTGLYSSGENKSDMLDAKRFVGVDMSVASSLIARSKAIESSNEHTIMEGKSGIYARIAGSFIGNLIDGSILDKTGGSIL